MKCANFAWQNEAKAATKRSCKRLRVAAVHLQWLPFLMPQSQCEKGLGFKADEIQQVEKLETSLIDFYITATLKYFL